MRDAAAKRFADAVVESQEPITNAFDFRTKSLKACTLQWARAATARIKDDVALRRRAWRHLWWETEDERAEIHAMAAELHAKDELFVSEVGEEVEPAYVEDEETVFEGDGVAEILDEAAAKEAEKNDFGVVFEEVLPEAADPTAASSSGAASSTDPPKLATTSVLSKCAALRLIYGRGP